MKKAISVLLAFVMAIGLLTTMAFASGEMKISGTTNVNAEYNEAQKGTYAVMDINVENAEAVAAVGIQLDLPEGITLARVVNGDSYNKATKDDGWGDTKPIFVSPLFNSDNGAINVHTEDFMNAAFPDGVLYEVYLLVDTETVENGTYEIGITTISNDPGNICNDAKEIVPCSFAAGSIVVTNGVEPAPETYTVTFDPQNGEDAIEVKANVGEAVIPPTTNPTKTDATGKVTYTFSHWSTSATEGVAVTNWIFNEDTTLYPVFTESTNTYTVTFDSQNGEGAIEVKANVGEAVIPPTTNPTFADTDTKKYEFKGWSTDKTDFECIINDWTTITEDTTVYALYNSQSKRYHVTFMNGEENYADNNFIVGVEPYVLPLNPTKDGCTFKHWSLEQNGVEVVWTDLREGNHTVYAVYQSNDGSVNQAYTITTELDKEEYRSGETVTATVKASAANDTNIAGFQMVVQFEDAYVDFDSITGIDSFAGLEQNANSHAVWFMAAEEGVNLTANNEVELFKVTYTVLNNVSAEDVPFTVENVYMMPYGYDTNKATNTINEDTADIIDTVEVTLTAGENGSVGTTTSFIVDKDSTLADLMDLTDYVVPTPNDNYFFNGWIVSSETGAILEDTYEFTGDTELVAIFAPKSFDITVADDTTDNAGVAFESGVVGNKVTYLTDVTFTVTPDAKHIISEVAYTVDGELGESLTAEDGVYTISGEKIIGDIEISVNAVKYVAITFEAGTGSTLAETTLYAKSGVAGLYANAADLTGTANGTIPTATANAGYRLAADTAIEPLWNDGTENQTTTWFETATFTEDATYTVNTVKTWNVHFDANSNGSVNDVTGNPYDDGAIITVPVPTPNAGYVFSGWNSNTSNTLGKDETTLTATEDVTYNAAFTEGTYDVTFPAITGVEFTEKTGLIDGKAQYNGSDVTFKILTNGVDVDTVKYTINGVEESLTAEDGVYTIPASEIKYAVSITVESTNLFTVSFVSGANGTVGDTTAFSVRNSETLGVGNFNTVTTTPDTGYKFDGWYIGEIKCEAPADQTVTAAVTYTAKFTQIHYTFTAADVTVNFKTGYDEDYAIYGRDVTFTISGTDKVITGVKLGDTDLEADENGVYKIPGSEIKGDTEELTLTVTSFDGTMEFINLPADQTGDSYMAQVNEANDRKIMLLEAGETNDSTYKLANGTELLWSEKYAAYVAIVADTETAQTLSAGMVSDSSKPAEAINYSGDVNNDEAVNVFDAIIVRDILHGSREIATSDAFLFRADVNGDKKISTTDVAVIKNTALGNQ